ncbi:MAG: triosephosphate isomerase [Candidatus Poseidoniales archaeon]|nr:MAG: triosephosphate isomerase [Candidatus Poseidoniales archaeon]|tara:strand:- start:6681 stop:7343 length:663 start_codon:yes stop_codon:yes gene_type:complete
MEPLVVVNHKTYETAQADAAVELAKAIRNAQRQGVHMISAVSAFDLSAVVTGSPGLTVWSQHLDPVGFGSNTGHLAPATAIARGAVGSLLNHSECRVSFEHIENVLSMLPDDFTICVCAATVEEATRIASLDPDFIAIEPPELIGGDISVTTADPAIVSDTVAAVHAVNREVRVLCGAGVKNGDDVAAAIDLGAHGVLLASGVTKASNPTAVLQDLIQSL